MGPTSDPLLKNTMNTPHVTNTATPAPIPIVAILRVDEWVSDRRNANTPRPMATAARRSAIVGNKTYTTTPSTPAQKEAAASSLDRVAVPAWGCTVRSVDDLGAPKS